MPTANTLTDAACRKPRPGKHFDGHGLFLHVTASAKTWRMAYRLDGKAQTATFGPYPLLTLAEARQKRDELRRKLLDGYRPAAQGRAQGADVHRGGGDLVEGRKDITPAYRMNAVRGLAMHIEPDIGSMHMTRSRATIYCAPSTGWTPPACMSTCAALGYGPRRCSTTP